MKINHVRKWAAGGVGDGDINTLPRYWGRGCSINDGKGDGTYKICRNGKVAFVSSLYFMHPFVPLSNFDAWMLHLQVEGRVKR